MILKRGDVVLYAGSNDYRLLGVIINGCVEKTSRTTVHRHTVRWLWRSQGPLSDTDVIPRVETMGDFFMTHIGSLEDHGVDMARYE